MQATGWGLLGALFASMLPDTALARPLETTDAGTTEAGAFSLELGMGISADAIAVPAALAVGLADGLELSLAGEAVGARTVNPPGYAVAPGESALALKTVFAEGFGLETSVAMTSDEGASGALVAILTQPVGDLALHANAGASWDGTALAMALSLAGEGPSAWPVRPVLEIGTETAAGEPVLVFGTAGAVVDVTDALTLDAALHATTDHHIEARLGLTAVIGGS